MGERRILPPARTGIEFNHLVTPKENAMNSKLRRTAWIALAIVGSFAAGHAIAQGRHTHIDEAQRDLRQAVRSLDRAPDIYGGHKRRAIDLIRAAQAELRQAERFVR